MTHEHSSSSAGAEGGESPAAAMPALPTHPALREELLAMMAADQAECQTPGGDDNSPPLYSTEASVRRPNTVKLRQIIDEYGWPTITMVGPDGAKAAWLIAQHSDHDRDFQHHVLALMTAVADRQEASHTHLAYLVDRVAVADGEPQTFGTQLFAGPGGRLAPHPIAHAEHVDARRHEVGLGPFAEYLASFPTSTTPPPEGHQQ